MNPRNTPYPYKSTWESGPTDLGCPQWAISIAVGKKAQREEQAQQPKKERPKSIKDLEGCWKGHCTETRGSRQ